VSEKGGLAASEKRLIAPSYFTIHCPITLVAIVFTGYRNDVGCMAIMLHFAILEVIMYNIKQTICAQLQQSQEPLFHRTLNN
jgi:hypothetical protein